MTSQDRPEVPLTDETNQALMLAGFRGTSALASNCYRFYTDRKPLKGIPPTWPWNTKGDALRELQMWMPYLRDSTIREVCQSLAVQAEILDQVNDEWSQALARFLALPPPQSEANLIQLRRMIDAYRKKNGAAWAAHEEFRPLVAKSRQLAEDIEKLWLQLEARLDQVYPGVLLKPGEFGDQRAKDMIDKAEGLDPPEAITLLKRSLRYGRTGIQASKAYHELGRLYKELGDADRAIENYTKSLDAWRKPNPMALFRRGELYYQRGQWTEARSDFERALSMEWLLSPEREQAQQYLSKIKRAE